MKHARELAVARAHARIRMSATRTPERRVALRAVRNGRDVLTPMSSASVALNLRALMHSPSDAFTKKVLAKLRVGGYDVVIPGVDPQPSPSRPIGRNLSKNWEVR